MRASLAVAALLAVSTPAFAQRACDYAGQAYSVGATVCECPGLKAENLSWTKEGGHITSRRLVCSAQHTWEDSKTLCLDVQMVIGAERLYTQTMNHFCPRLPVNTADIQRALQQETSRFVALVPKSTILTMLDGICRRFQIEASCKPVLDALTSADNLN